MMSMDFDNDFSKLLEADADFHDSKDQMNQSKMNTSKLSQNNSMMKRHNSDSSFDLRGLKQPKPLPTST